MQGLEDSRVVGESMCTEDGAALGKRLGLVDGAVSDKLMGLDDGAKLGKSLGTEDGVWLGKLGKMDSWLSVLSTSRRFLFRSLRGLRAKCSIVVISALSILLEAPLYCGDADFVGPFPPVACAWQLRHKIL